jgi:predicted kinase
MIGRPDPEAVPDILLITGIMAAGKSTVAQALAQRLPRSVHLRGDLFRRLIVSGRADMMPDPSPEALRQLELRYELAATVACRYAAAGFKVVYQDIVLGPHLAKVAAALRGRPLGVIVLCPSPDIVAAREAGRRKRGYGLFSPDHLDRALRTETPRIGLWVDNSHLGVEESVDHILANLDQARTPATAF